MALSSHATQIKARIKESQDNDKKFSIIAEGNITYSNIHTATPGTGFYSELVILTVEFGGVRSSYNLAGDNIYGKVYLPYEKIVAVVVEPGS